MNRWEELVSANRWAELVNVNSWEELVRVNSWEELVNANNWSPSVVALVAFQPSGDIAEWQCSLSWSDS